MSPVPDQPSRVPLDPAEAEVALESKSMVRAILDDRIVTAPNIITLIRLLFIPVFLWLLFSEENRAAAAVVLAVMAATDWVDGQVARRWGQVSELGKILDPAADRLLLVVAVVAITVDGSAPLWLSIPVLVREVIMFAAVSGLAALGARRIDVTFVGKAGTFLLMSAFPLLLLGNSTFAGASIAEFAGYACAVPGLALSWYATLTYIPPAMTALREGRAVRRQGTAG